MIFFSCKKPTSLVNSKQKLSKNFELESAFGLSGLANLEASPCFLPRISLAKQPVMVLILMVAF